MDEDELCLKWSQGILNSVVGKQIRMLQRTLRTIINFIIYNKRKTTRFNALIN